MHDVEPNSDADIVCSFGFAISVDFVHARGIIPTMRQEFNYAISGSRKKILSSVSKKPRHVAHKAHAALLARMRKRGVLRSHRILKAFKRVNRIDFTPEEFKENAYLDVPIPIDAGMTTSQPSTIAFMLEALKPKRGDTILEIGTGSGYMTALLAYVVGAGGRVYSIELSPELHIFASNNLKKYDCRNVTLYLGDGKKGLPEKAPFQKIISAAEVSEVPAAWKEQIQVGGTIVTPLNGHLLKIDRISKDQFREHKYPHFEFVKMK